MPASSPTLSTADLRRETVIRSAVVIFAGAGYLGTPTSAIAEHAQISTAYVFKLFPRKQELFVAAFDACCDQIIAALETGADHATTQTPDALLAAMGHAYAQLIADRSLMLLQVHAQSTASEPEIAAALRGGLGRIVSFVKSRSQASDEAVQHFVAYGQLCHLITVAGLDDNTTAWARLLTKGIQYF